MRLRLSTLIPLLVMLIAFVEAAFLLLNGVRSMQAEIRHQAEEELRITLGRLQGGLQFLVSENRMDRVQAEFSAFGIDPTVTLAFLVDDAGQVLASMHRSDLNRHLNTFRLGTPAQSRELLDALNALRAMPAGALRFLQDGSRLLGAYPVPLGVSEGSLRTDRMAHAVLLRDLASLERNGRRELLTRMLPSMLAIGILAALLAVWLHVLITRRVRRLVDVTEQFAGDQRVPKMPLTGTDELASLGSSLHSMMAQVAAARASLLEQGETLELLLDSTAEGIYGVDVQGRCSFVNATCLRLFGIEQESELLGRDMRAFAFMASDHRGAALPDLDRVLKQGQGVSAQALLAGPGVPQPVAVEYWIFPIHRQDALVGAVVTFLDIRERLAAEQARKLTETRFRAIFDSTYQFIGLLDPRGTLLEANRTSLSFAGVDRGEVIGRPFWETAWWAKSPQAAQRLRTAVARAAKGEFQRFEAEHLAPDGSRITVDFSLTPVTDTNGEVVMLVPEGRDITERKREQEQLRLTQYSIDHMADAAYWISPSGRFVRVNDAALQALGYSLDEMLNMSVPDIDANLDQNMWDEHWRDLQRMGFVGLESVHQCKDGSEFPVAISANYVRFEEQEFVCAFVRDISARKTAEQALQASESRFRSLANVVPVGIFQTDPEGACVYVNRRWSEITGLEMGEARGHGWARALHPDDSGRVFARWRQCSERKETFRAEYRFRRPDGEERWVFGQAASQQDAEGEVTGYVGAITDITEFRQLQHDLARVEMQWDRALDFFADPLYLVDLDDKVQLANQAFFNLVGRPSEEIIGQDIVALMHPEGETEPCPVCAARRERRDARLEMEVDNPDNPFAWPAEIMVRVIRDQDDSPLGILIGVRNLTRQRELETELRAHRDHLEELVRNRTRALEATNRELESFSYSVSHDLRGPLRAIDGFSQALQEEYDALFDDQARNYLGRVRAASQRMGELIDDLLLLSRYTREPLSPVSVNLAELARDVVEELNEAHPDRNVAFAAPDMASGYGDPRLLRAVLGNLLENAWKYTARRDAAKVEFGVLPATDERVFYVRDNGAGFDMRYADKLFGPFQRLHHPSEFEGTGIGLATVDRIIARHGGRVWAEGESDQGACFYFALPVPKGASGPLAPPQSEL